MAESSFYGGKAGHSFVIVKTFATYDEMVEAFSWGPAYTDVHYDEYVLINTEDKNDKYNGSVYRRGYDYTNEAGGAIYIGTIVGPSGPAPHVELDTYKNIHDRPKEQGVQYRYSEGEYTTVNDVLVPGKVDGKEEYNDSIKWNCYSVRTPNNDDCIAYIGFELPYPVIDFESERVDAYQEQSTLVSRSDNKTHPFYEKWKIKVPRGIKGDAFKNLRVIKASNEDSVQTDDEIYTSEEQQNDRTGSREILVYDYYNYEDKAEGEKTILYLGDYNMIDDISIDEEGTLTIQYSHDDDYKKEKLFKWIKDVRLTPQGKFTVTYNQTYEDENGEKQNSKYETYLTWVRDLRIDEQGNVTIVFSYGGSKTLTTKIKWVKDIVLDRRGTITVTYNDGSTKVFEQKLRWVAATYIDDKGNLAFYYNDGTHNIFPHAIKVIKSVTYSDDDQKLHVSYNTGEEDTIDKQIKFIDHIYLDDDTYKHQDGESEKTEEGIEHDYLFHAVYNTKENVKLSDQPVNFIDKIIINKENYHLLIHFTNKNIIKKLTENNTKYQKVEYDSINDWLDLGSIKDDAGILVGFNLDPEHLDKLPDEVPPIEEPPYTLDNPDNHQSVIEFLNKYFPNGLTNTKYYGKIVTVGDEGENKDFYAFDYDKEDWYYLGNFEDTSPWIMIAENKNENETLKQQKDSLHNGGIWFVLEGEDDPPAEESEAEEPSE